MFEPSRPRIRPRHEIGAAEIARELGISTTTFYNSWAAWSDRTSPLYLAFPAPVRWPEPIERRPASWYRAEVEAWLTARRAALGVPTPPAATKAEKTAHRRPRLPKRKPNLRERLIAAGINPDNRWVSADIAADWNFRGFNSSKESKQ